MAGARRHGLLIVVLAAAIAIATACSSDSNSSGASEPTASRPAGSTAAPRPTYRLDDRLRLNEVQVLGSHNSYHATPFPEVLAALRGVNPATAAGLDYGHRPLPDQFDLGVRQIELDVWSDPDGGKYADPSLLQSLDLPPPDPAVMNEPGFKVIHEANIDTRSTCLTFVLCLRAVKTWSDAHPGHVPIMIEVEMKDATEDVTPGTFDALEAEIRSVFEPDDLITPDDVRGTDPSLGYAVRTRGWPTLGEVRGRVLFTLDNEALANIERRDHPSLRGRILFAPSAPGEHDAAFAKLNDPIRDAAKIKAALAANMLVRTRADADTVQARSGDTKMRDTALAGGAQFVSTDYEVPDPRFPEYDVRIPGGTPARCDPVTAPPECRPTDVEDPRLLAAPS
jgi:Phosphoinositide phospholipase C, Ca2+-dependent